MKGFHTPIYLLLFTLMTTSCTTYTKDQYLLDYQSFLLEVEKGHNTYDDATWRKQDVKNENFYTNDFKQFAGELSPSEYIRVQRYNFAYRYYRGEINISDLLSGKYNTLLKDIAVESSELIKELSSMLYGASQEDKLQLMNKLLQ